MSRVFACILVCVCMCMCMCMRTCMRACTEGKRHACTKDGLKPAQIFIHTSCRFVFYKCERTVCQLLGLASACAQSANDAKIAHMDRPVDKRATF